MALEEPLKSLSAKARRGFPTLLLDERLWEHFLEERAAGSDPSALHAEDLYLAHGCAQGDPEALRLFEEAHFPNLGTHLSRMTPSAHFVEEVRQTLRVKLFVAQKGEAPGIAAYGGRGPLGAWFRVTALNTALKLRRSENRAEDVHAAHAAEENPSSPSPPGQRTPEAALIRERIRAELQDAIRQVLKELPPKQRALLRLHFLNGLSLEEVGQTFKVHRATAARWIASARQEILKETQRLLSERLKLSESELSSALQMSRSDWTLSLTSLLGQADADELAEKK